MEKKKKNKLNFRWAGLKSNSKRAPLPNGVNAEPRLRVVFIVNRHNFFQNKLFLMSNFLHSIVVFQLILFLIWFYSKLYNFIKMLGSSLRIFSPRAVSRLSFSTTSVEKAEKLWENPWKHALPEKCKLFIII